jgi:hypothetical protein
MKDRKRGWIAARIRQGKHGGTEKIVFPLCVGESFA